MHRLCRYLRTEKLNDTASMVSSSDNWRTSPYEHLGFHKYGIGWAAPDIAYTAHRQKFINFSHCNYSFTLKRYSRSIRDSSTLHIR